MTYNLTCSLLFSNFPFVENYPNIDFAISATVLPHLRRIYVQGNRAFQSREQVLSGPRTSCSLARPCPDITRSLDNIPVHTHKEPVSCLTPGTVKDETTAILTLESTLPLAIR
jgi:hypothetical protein